MTKKTPVILITILWACLAVSTVTARDKFIFQSESSGNNIFLEDAKTSKKKAVSEWSKTGAGYLIDCQNPDETTIVFTETAVFKLYRLSDKKSTRWISLKKGQKILIKDCFSMYPFEALVETDPNQFIVSNYINNPLSEDVIGLRSITQDFEFTTGDYQEFLNQESLTIGWETGSKIKKGFIVDMSKPEIVWEGKISGEKLDFESLKDGMKSKFEKDHKYQLNVILENPYSSNMDGDRFDCEFSIKALTFDNKSHAFINLESLAISWQTEETTDKITITDKSGKQIWSVAKSESKNFDRSVFRKELKDLIVPGTFYYFNIHSGEDIYSFDFVVVMTEKEYSEFKRFIDN